MPRAYIGSMASGYQALTDKEKETLRLLLEGHDAKSIARHLGLSIHTVHERLRDARRKMAVSSSREAARLLRESERAHPQSSGDTGIGVAAGADAAQASPQPAQSDGDGRRTGWIAGVFAMTLSLALLALSSLSGQVDAPTAARQVASSAEAPAAQAALRWLALVDAQDFTSAYAATGQSFRRNNTVAGWTKAASSVRAKYGETSERRALSNEWVPAPPNGYRIVKFRTMTSKQGAITETLSLAEEGGEWKVVGIVID